MLIIRWEKYQYGGRINDDADNNVWKSIGKCLHLFNNKEIYHPDLNTNNILIDDELNVYLIDFDKTKLQTVL